MRSRRTVVLTLAIALAIVPLSLGATTRDWDQWRGPNQNFISLGNGAFDRESFGLEIAWKKPLGPGYSSIVIADGRAVTMFSDGVDDLVVALDVATGAELWRYRIATTYEGHDGSEDGPLGTPTIHDGVVYGLGPKGQLFALRLADGHQLWAQQIDQQYGAVAPNYGFTTGAIVAGDVLVVQLGGPEGRSIAGLDLQTGELRWSTGDDPVEYHSPLVANFGGEEQIVAVNNKYLLGLAPADGRELWRYAYTEEEHNPGGQPIVVEEDKLLIVMGHDLVLYRVVSSEDGFAIEELWRTDAIRYSASVPIYYQGYVYGYRGNVLTCVDAKTGERMWRSRPPGNGGLVLIDGHLLVLGQRGDLVVVEATPSGYVEKARLRVSERESLSAPSFAGGLVFVRNTTDVAAVTVTDQPTAESQAAAAEPMERLGKFGEFVRKVEAAENKTALIDKFLAEQESFPIIEGDALAHFVYRGDVEDLVVSGGMLDYGAHEVMHRVAGTDLYFRSFELTPGAHYEYQFGIFEDRMPDPLNPRRLSPAEDAPSAMTMPGWEEPAHLREPAGERGRIETFNFTSEALGNEREVQVYLPPGYDAGGERYPLVVVNYGDEALRDGLMANTLDNVGGKSVRPLIAAFLPRVTFDEYGPRVNKYTTMVAEELVPYLDAHYRTLPGAENRALMGIASGGFAATFAALSKPDLAAKVAVQSFYFRQEASDELRAMIDADQERAVELYVEWSINDLHAEGLECEKDSREFAALLQEKGYRVTTNEVVHGGGWGSWRANTDRILAAFFPIAD